MVPSGDSAMGETYSGMKVCADTSSESLSAGRKCVLSESESLDDSSLRAQRREGDPWVALVIVWRRWTAPSVAVCLIGIGGGVFEVRIDFCPCRLGVAIRVVWARLEGKGTHHDIEVRERGLQTKLPSAHTGKAFCTYERRVM